MLSDLGFVAAYLRLAICFSCLHDVLRNIIQLPLGITCCKYRRNESFYPFFVPDSRVIGLAVDDQPQVSWWFGLVIWNLKNSSRDLIPSFPMRRIIRRLVADPDLVISFGPQRWCGRDACVALPNCATPDLRRFKIKQTFCTFEGFFWFHLFPRLLQSLENQLRLS